MFSTIVIGLGNIGMHYDIALDNKIWTHCKSLKLHDSFDLIGAVDSEERNRFLFSEEYKLPVAEDLETILTELGREPDIFIIATPTETHKSIIENISKLTNTMAILCEKPLSYGVEEAKDIKEICDSNNIKLFVNFIRRSDPGIKIIQERIERDKIQAPHKIVLWYSKGLIHNGSHFVDLFTFLFGPSTSFKIIKAGDEEGKHSEPDFLLEFNSAQVFFINQKAKFFSNHMFIMSSANGHLTYFNDGNLIWKNADLDNASHGNINLSKTEELIEGDMDKYQYNVLTDMKKDLTEGTCNLSSLQDGLDNVILVNEIIDSI